MCWGFIEEGLIRLPKGKPVPREWPEPQDLLRLLRAAGRRWKELGLPLGAGGGEALWPPGYEPATAGEEEEECARRLARDFRAKLDRPFEGQEESLTSQAHEDAKQLVETGSSGQLELRLQAFILRPNTTFKLHAHAAMELELTLRGALGEIRLAGKRQEGNASSLLRLPHRGPFKEREVGSDLVGPNFSSLRGSPYEYLLQDACWKQQKPIVPGEYLANEVGSIHQSFSMDQPFAGMALWGGCHANILPHEMGTEIEGSELLRPV